MFSLIRPRLWTEKPPVGVPVNWGHPLANGLIGCWLFNERGVIANNLGQYRVPGTLTGSNILRGMSKYGGNVQYNATSATSYVSLPAGPYDFEATQPFTIELLIYYVTAFETSAFGTFNAGANKGILFSLNNATTGANRLNLVMISSFPGNYLWAYSAAGLTANAWNHVVVTYDGSSAVAGVGFYINGLSQAVSSQVNSLSGSITSGAIAAIGRAGANTGGGSPNGTIYSHCRVWERALNAGEVRDLYDHPYGMFSPAVKPVLFVADSIFAVSGSDTLGLTLEGASATSAQLERNDDLPLALDESPEIQALLHRADSLGLGLTETVLLLVLLSGAETLDIGISEALNIVVALNDADSLDVSLLEALSLLGVLLRPDALNLSLSESPEIQAILNRADSIHLGLSGTALLAALLAGADTLEIDISDAVNIVVALSGADALNIDFAEILALLGILLRTDALNLSLPESLTILGTLLRGDNLAVNTSEESEISAALNSADAFSVSVATLSGIVGALQSEDTVNPALDGVTSGILAALNRTDALTLSLEQATAILVLLALADSLETGLAEQSALEISAQAVQVIAGDALSPGLLESSPDLLALLNRVDEIAPGLLDALRELEAFPKFLSKPCLSERLAVEANVFEILGVRAQASEILAATATLHESLLENAA